MLCYSDGIGKAIRFTHVLAASFAGLIAAAAASRYRKQESTVVTDEKIIPQVDKTESGRLEKIEKFSHYVGMFHFFWDSCKLASILSFLFQSHCDKDYHKS